MIPLPPIYFYLAPSQWPQSWPQSPTENWPGFGLGIYAWTLQTYLQLSAAGVPCELIRHLPETGIVLAHSNSLRAISPRPKLGQALLLICLKAESPLYPYAQLHVVQNRVEANGRDRIFLPHWPQPGLLTRNPHRGNRFENLGFLGHRYSLAPELQQADWLEFLDRLNLHWHPVVNTNHWSDYSRLDARWHDYRELDAIIAVRSFKQPLWPQLHLYPHKPATKLYNAWLAGVPAILGPESAFLSERQHPLDYVEVTSFDALKAAVIKLNADETLRQQIVTQGQRRAAALDPEQITARWIAFLQSVALPAYDRWCAQSTWQQWVQLQRGSLHTVIDKVQHKLRDQFAA